MEQDKTSGKTSAESTVCIFNVQKHAIQETLEKQGCMFTGQELLSNHELDPSKPCYCGRPLKKIA